MKTHAQSWNICQLASFSVLEKVDSSFLPPVPQGCLFTFAYLRDMSQHVCRGLSATCPSIMWALELNSNCQAWWQAPSLNGTISLVQCHSFAPPFIITWQTQKWYSFFPQFHGQTRLSGWSGIFMSHTWQTCCCFYSVLSYFCQGSDKVLRCVRAWQSA